MHAEAQAAARQQQQQQQQRPRRIQPVQAQGVLAEMAEFMRLADADEVRSRVSVDAQQRLSTWLPINGPVEQSHVLPGCIYWKSGVCKFVRFSRALCLNSS